MERSPGVELSIADVLPSDMFPEIFVSFSMKETFRFSLVSKEWLQEKAWICMRQIDDIAPGFEKTIPFLSSRINLLRNVTSVSFTDLYLSEYERESLLKILTAVAPRLEHISIPVLCLGASGYNHLFSRINKPLVQSVTLHSAENALGDWRSLRKLELFSSDLTPESTLRLADATKNLNTLIIHINHSKHLPFVKLLVEANPHILQLNVCLPGAANDVISYAFGDYEDDLIQLPLASIGLYGLPISKLLFDSDDVFRVLLSNSLHRLDRQIAETIFNAVFPSPSHRRRLQALTIAAIRLVHFDPSNEKKKAQLLDICTWMNAVAVEETEPASVVETKFAAFAALEFMKLSLYRPELDAISQEFWFERFKSLMMMSEYVAGEIASAMLQERSSLPVLEMCLQDKDFSDAVGLPNHLALGVLQSENGELRDDLRRVLDTYGIYYGD